MADRRAFLAGLLATGLAPKQGWADAGSPAYLSAGRKPDGTYALFGLGADAGIVFELPLPGRGHAAAAHPTRPEAVAFARRPGRFAIVLDCALGREKAHLAAPEGRHFYGHGAFSADGRLLFTTENDFEAGQGIVGVWAADEGYRRIAEFSSGGVGPHDIKLMPGGGALVIANGGIETHPETGRSKLNLPTMRSNLSYIGLDGRGIAQLQLDDGHRKNSIRHLAVAQDGTVAFAMQWQGDLASDLPLLGLHRISQPDAALMPEAGGRRLNGYLGSIAISDDGQAIAVTSPRGNLLQEYRRGLLAREARIADVCGVAMAQTGFMATSGTGRIALPNGGAVTHAIAWDNHLIRI